METRKLLQKPQELLSRIDSPVRTLIRSLHVVASGSNFLDGQHVFLFWLFLMRTFFNDETLE